jgi:hypothetical protein
LLATAGHAETQLAGGVDAVRMEARDASIEEVLTAIGASYGLRFRTAVPLGGRTEAAPEPPKWTTLLTVCHAGQ